MSSLLSTLMDLCDSQRLHQTSVSPADTLKILEMLTNFPHRSPPFKNLRFMVAYKVWVVVHAKRAMVLSKVMPFLRTVYFALVHFDRKILPYTPKFCNRECGLQPTLYCPNIILCTTAGRSRGLHPILLPLLCRKSRPCAMRP